MQIGADYLRGIKEVRQRKRQEEESYPQIIQIGADYLRGIEEVRQRERQKRRVIHRLRRLESII